MVILQIKQARTEKCVYTDNNKAAVGSVLFGPIHNIIIIIMGLCLISVSRVTGRQKYATLMDREACLK